MPDQCNRCHNFQYCGQYIAIFWKKYSLVYLYIWLRRTRIRIRQNDVDPPDPKSTRILRLRRLECWNSWHVQVEDLGFTKLLRMLRLKVSARAGLRDLLYDVIAHAQV